MRVVYKALKEIGADLLIQNELKLAVRTLQTFGFHTAHLDVRQNSHFHDIALSGLLEIAGVPNAKDYPSWKPEEKAKLIEKELQTTRPLTIPGMEHEGKTNDVLSCYHVLNEYIQNYGEEGIGSLIVSMTHTSGDLFTVYLLAREAGILKWIDGQLVCPLNIVPLFETVEDLKNSGEILEQFLSHPVTKASLAYQKDIRGYDKPTQQIMVGYSDSCKDGGIMSSQWNLYLAQKEMDEVARRFDVDLCFFHGRGGTVSRGAGPIHRFLQALPKGTFTGTFRMTDQGETIAQKYANFATAVYNVELLMASLTEKSLEKKEDGDSSSEFQQIMSTLSQKSFETYRQLITAPRFVEFFQTATPIDVIEQCRIGSRPSKRTGKKTLDDLRAIPWVFGWNQARFYLPSWYGVGSALHSLKEDHPELFAKLKQTHGDYKLLSYVLHNVEITIYSANEEIMKDYATLVEDETLRQTFMKPILEEFHKTRALLSEIFGGSIEERRPHVSKTIALRHSGLPLLHKMQIQQIRQWRKVPEVQQRDEKTLEMLLVTVNAIASGLRNTG